MEFNMPRQIELAPEVPVDLATIRQPRYGHFLEGFQPGAIFHHPRGMTIPAGLARSFATTFMQSNPLYLNESYATSHGFRTLLLSPMMVLNIALSLGVQNDSEQAIAHLGYYHVEFPRPVYAGDTLRSETEVLSRRVRGQGKEGRPKPGVVRLRTQALNQQDQVVVRYERAVLVPVADASKLTGGETAAASTPDLQQLPLDLPQLFPHAMPQLTGSGSYFDDFMPGDIILHGNGRTITAEHIPWTYHLGNSHPLHYDRLYSSSRSGPMSGEPIVYGGLVFAWLEGLASRDCSENALWDLGYTEGYHTQPAVAGDTLYAISRVLAKEDGPASTVAGVITMQLIGVKNITPAAAVEKHGRHLFQKEITKLRTERIPEKLFEIERRLLVKKRPAT